MKCNPMDPGHAAGGAVKYRIDAYAKLVKSSNAKVREAANLLIKNAIASSKTVAQKWSASELKTLYRRTIAGSLHRELHEAYREAVKVAGVKVMDREAFNRKFMEDVTALSRGDTSVLARNPTYAAQLSRASSAQVKFYSTMADKLNKAEVAGAENLKAAGNYVNRIWRQDYITEAIRKYGPDAVHQALANSIRVPGLRGDKAKAAKFLGTVRKLEYDHNLQDIVLNGHDALLLRAELKKSGRLTPSEIDNLIDFMFEHRPGKEADAGAPPNLKYRFDIDESHVEMINGEEFRVSSMFENDARILADQYMNHMGGHLALAELGVKSRRDWENMVRAMDDEHEAKHANTEGGSRYASDRKDLQDLYDNITGRPMSMQTFNTADRVLNGIRAFTRGATLNQLGVSSAFEMFNVLGMSTARAFFAHVPSFAGLIRALRTGRIPNEAFGRDLEAMVGAGFESAASYARQHEIHDFTYDRGLSQFENLGNKISHITDAISGNRFFTAITRQVAASVFLQKHLDFALGKRKLDAGQRERLVGQGLDDAEIDAVLKDLKAHTKTDHRGIAMEVDWEGWQKANQDTYDSYRLALMRETREGIQDHDIGELPLAMHGSIFKMFAELRTFNMAAHAKNFLKNIHFRDQQAATSFMYGFLAQAVAYSMQTSANFAHNEEELQKRLSLDRIAKAAIGRMSQLGMTSMLFETGYAVGTGGGSFFNDSSANTGNRNLFITPSMMMLNRLYSGAGLIGGAINPFDSSTATQKEVKGALSALPFSNWYGVRNAIDMISSTYPSHEPKQ